MSKFIMNSKQRRWYFAHANGNRKGISGSLFDKPEHPLRPTSGIKVTQSIKKPKEEKVTDTIGVNVGFMHFDHSIERTFETEN